MRTHWILVVMDQYSRRIIGFGVHAGPVDGVALCRMFNRAIRWQLKMPKYLSADNDPLYRFHQWQANLRVLKDVPATKPVARRQGFENEMHAFQHPLLCLQKELMRSRAL